MITIQNKYSNEETERYYKFILNQRPIALGNGGHSSKIVHLLNTLSVKKGYERVQIANFKELITMDYKKIKELKNSLDINCDDYKQKMDEHKKLLGTYKGYYKAFFSNIDNSTGLRNNVSLIQDLGVIVCPYCNRNYINSRKDRLGANFDHFFDKNTYPFLALSLYNLIPCCNTCNVIKQNYEIDFCPFDLDYNKEINFFVSPKADIEVRVSDIEQEEKNFIKIMKLNEAYQIHQEDIKEMFYREYEYCFNYRLKLNEIIKRDQNSGDDEIDFYISGEYFDHMIHGKIADNRFDNYLNTPISKLKRNTYEFICNELRIDKQNK